MLFHCSFIPLSAVNHIYSFFWEFMIGNIKRRNLTLPSLSMQPHFRKIYTEVNGHAKIIFDPV